MNYGNYDKDNYLCYKNYDMYTNNDNVKYNSYDNENGNNVHVGHNNCDNGGKSRIM